MTRNLKMWMGIFAVVVLALAPAAAPAALLTLQSEHNLTPIVYQTSGTPTFLTPTGGTIYSGIDGLAYYNFVNPPASHSNATLTIGTDNSVNSSLGALTWLQQTTAGVAYEGSNDTFTITQTFKGSAPNPSAPGNCDGFLDQWGYYVTNIPASFSLSYTLVQDQNYTVSLVDAYSFLYELDNSDGSTNGFCSTTGDLELWLAISYSGGDYSGRQWIVGASGPDTRTGTPVGDFKLENNAGNATLSLTITDADAGTLTFDGYVVARQYGDTGTPIPLPASALLLGTGLVGLGLLGRRRWWVKK